jgi:hypothetical protein
MVWDLERVSCPLDPTKIGGYISIGGGLFNTYEGVQSDQGPHFLLISPSHIGPILLFQAAILAQIGYIDTQDNLALHFIEIYENVWMPFLHGVSQDFKVNIINISGIHTANKIY